MLLRVEEISKKFGRFQAIDNVSFELKKGEVLGFLGPNGAGKTTTVRILTGFFPPSKGKVWIDDIDLFRNPYEAKKRIGYLPEQVSLYTDLRIEEFLHFVAKVKGVGWRDRKMHVEEKLGKCGLWESRRKLIGHLSKGYRQRVGLAQALIGDPDVLVLDEPTSGLDPKQIIEIRNLIRELGQERMLIVSTHILPEVNMLCDRVLIMNQGRIVASGTTDELEAGLQKAHEIFVVMGDPRKKKKAMELLKGLEGVERIVVKEEDKTSVSLALVVSKGGDLRPMITRLFVENQLPLLEIRSGRLSLEEIFMKIVVQETPGKELV